MTATDHIKRAEQALAAQPDTSFTGWHLQLVDHRPNHTRGGRSILRATAPDAASSIIVKVYDRPDAAQTQFRAQEKLAKLTSQIVKPVFLAPAHNLFAMQDAGDTTLAHRLTADDGTDVTRKALEWLGRFNHDTPQYTYAFNTDPILAVAKRETEHMPDQFHKYAPEVLARLHRHFQPFQGKPMIHCTSFSDLKPENLCVDQKTGRVTGIDYLPDRAQPVERDVAFLLCWMQQHNWRRVLNARQTISIRDERMNYKTAFETLKGQLDPALLDAFICRFMINTWHKLAFFDQSPDLIRTVEVRLGLRSRAALLRPSLRRLIRLFR